MVNTCRKILYYNGRTIILHDYRNLQGKAYIEAVEYNGKMGQESALQERLILMDVSDSIVDKEVMKAFKRVSQKASSTVSKTAVVGVKGIQKIFISTVAAISGIDIQTFNNQEEAKEWLTRRR